MDGGGEGRGGEINSATLQQTSEKAQWQPGIESRKSFCPNFGKSKRRLVSIWFAVWEVGIDSVADPGFLEGWGSAPTAEWGAPNYHFAKFLPKTARQWNNLTGDVSENELRSAASSLICMRTHKAHATRWPPFGHLRSSLRVLLSIATTRPLVHLSEDNFNKGALRQCKVSTAQCSSFTLRQAVYMAVYMASLPRIRHWDNLSY